MITKKIIMDQLWVLKQSIEPSDSSYHFGIDSISDGENRRHQLVVEDTKFCEVFSLPKYHVKTKEFSFYLQGMIDVLDRIERGQLRMKKERKTL